MVVGEFSGAVHKSAFLEWRGDLQSAEAEHAAKATYDLAQRQLGLGTISVIAVLNAEQAYRQAELSRVQAQANRYTDTAGLFQSLGGGWWNRTQEPHYEQFSPPGE